VTSHKWWFPRGRYWGYSKKQTNKQTNKKLLEHPKKGYKDGEGHRGENV